jgi:hypothetical protein
MAGSLLDQTHEPDDDELHAALGGTKPHWDAILGHLDTLDGVIRDWKFYGGGHGWQLKARDRKAALLYLIPKVGTFVAALPLNDAAVRSLPDTKLPSDVIAAIQAARPAMEGRPARIEVTAAKHVKIVKTLLAISRAARPGAAAKRR